LAPEAGPQKRALVKDKEQLGMIKELALALLDQVESLAEPRDTAPASGGDETVGEDFYEMIAAYEKLLIRQALVKARGNQARAARLLRLKPTTLHHKMKVYDIRPTRRR
jgi:DNA-binding NtrC family response regulator